MTRLLVTGGAGFIGSAFVRAAVRAGREVRVLDKLTYAGNKENLRTLLDAGKIEFLQGDVCDPAAARKAIEGCDAVVHFAAETHVDRSILEAGSFVQTDMFGTYVMLEAARAANVDRFLHISTDEVYGESGNAPSREVSPLMPKSPYAASKAGADRLVYSFATTYDFPAVITRCVNNYGPYQHPEKAIALFSICAILGHPLPVYGTGRNRREWIHVDDHVNVLLRLLRARGVDGETFNVGTGERRSTLEIARAVVGGLGAPSQLIEKVADRPGHVWSHAVSSAKLRRTLGWAPRRTFGKELPHIAGWYADHPGWWRSTILGSARSYFENRYPGLVEAVARIEAR